MRNKIVRLFCESIMYDVIEPKKESIVEVSNALEDGKVSYEDGEKYHGLVPEIRYMNPKLIRRLNSHEVGSVSNEVAATMDFSEPIEVSLYRDGEIICQNGHHRLAAAKQRNMPFIGVKVTAINAYGKMINGLIQSQDGGVEKKVESGMKYLRRN